MDQQVLKADWKYPGELPGSIKVTDGLNPLAPAGVDGCQIGLDSWFANGIPVGITIDDVVIPECCLPPTFPVVGTSRVPEGFPDWNTTNLDVNATDYAVAAIILGATTANPNYSPWWTPIQHSQLGTTQTWNASAWSHGQPPGPTLLAFDVGGDGDVSAGIIVSIQDSITGVVANQTHQLTSVMSIDSPVLHATEHALLLVFVWWDHDQLGVFFPDDFDVVDTFFDPAGSCVVLSKSFLTTGPTPVAHVTFSSPTTVAIQSVLIQ